MGVKFSGPMAGKGISEDLHLQEQSHNGPSTKVLSPSQVVFANGKNGNGNGFGKNKNKTPMENDQRQVDLNLQFEPPISANPQNAIFDSLGACDPPPGHKPINFEEFQSDMFGTG